jgi:hypothetical protein
VKLLDKHYSAHKQQTAEALELLGEILLLEGERIEEAENAVRMIYYFSILSDDSIISYGMCHRLESDCNFRELS